MSGAGLLGSVFYFLLALGLLIAFHEFGHFWVARRLGVKVLRFSIGFGPTLWQRTGRDGTEYALAAFPLGGYVRMLDEREGEVPPEERHRAFNRQGVGTRIAIVAAGPAFNFLLAVLLYWAAFMLGVSGIQPVVGEVRPDSPAYQAGLEPGDRIVAVGDEPTATWNEVVLALLRRVLEEGRVELEVERGGTRRVLSLDLSRVAGALDRGNLLETVGLRPVRPQVPPRLAEVEPGGPADRAGLRPGDLIVAVDGRPMPTWEAFVRYVRAHPGQVLKVRVRRGGQSLTLSLRPEPVQAGAQRYGRIGAAVQVPPDLLAELRVVRRYAPPEALGKALAKTWEVSALTLRMLGGMVTGQVSMANLSGPISIAQYAASSATAGLVAFLGFLAVVSISLGVINLLPVPLLDGGHLLYYLVELVKGSPVSETAQAVGQRIGIAVLLGLMALAFYNDLAHLLR
ncbi:MAG: RIP metalloprotease RseP [Gammaproteobacteria bacterium]|nr:MAG: RIP metalloprotease RseP [Gammaproteobacteria bacterium]